MSKRLLQRLLASIAATAVFFGAAYAIAVSAPYVLGLLYSCVPPQGSCGDSVGWAMVFSAPISVPLALLFAGALATMAYMRVMRSKLF